ncbi:hypothetical protein HDU76_010851 [Blyttiomyces sp. JEL0837]|nr:hypothetical protein HDU76_010851 [Blyttiomyces sp. JEL0837]
MPLVLRDEASTIKYGYFSGEGAWEHVRAISEKPHMYNSYENLQVRQYLIDSILKFQQISIEKGRPDFIELSTDMVNLTSANGTHETNRDALLISSHFDSTPVSPGVTDDGISVGVMLELIRSLIYNDQLEHDIIMNFNNGEEMYLFGGMAFVRHAWFSDVKGFVNLEGTGSAPGTRSMLFRTNSLEIMKKWKGYAPYPHASILFNDLVKNVKSETDYRAYVGFGHLEGVDIAFYTYPTPADDVDHSDPISAQHMGDNLRALTIAVCNSDVLPNLKEAPNVKKPLDDKLPTPNFVYYDLFASFTLTSGFSYKGMLSLIIIIVLVSTGVKMGREFLRMGRKRLFHLYIKPTLESYLLIWFTLVTTLFGIFLLSRFKSYVNFGSTYGRPVLNLFWIAMWSLASIAGCQYYWPLIAAKLRLRKPGFRLNTLSTHGELSGDEGTNTSVAPVSEAIPRRGMPIAIPLQSSTGPSVHKWLPYGLLGFWTTLVFGALIASMLGFHGLFFLSDWAFFSLLSVGLTQAIAPQVLKWWRAEVVDSDLSSWKVKMVKFYERQMWGLQLIISSSLPALLTFDILEQLSTILPTVISDGVSETAIDMSLSALMILLFLNLLPAFQLGSRSFLAAFFFALFVPTFLTASFLFPFQSIRPHKFMFAQKWDISNATVAAYTNVTMDFIGFPTSNVKPYLEKYFSSNLECVDQLCMSLSDTLPTIPNWKPDQNPSDLIQIEINKTPDQAIDKHAHDGMVELGGKFIGTPESRVCELSLEYTHLLQDKSFAIWIDPRDVLKGYWVLPYLSANMSDGVTPRPGASVDEIDASRRFPPKDLVVDVLPRSFNFTRPSESETRSSVVVLRRGFDDADQMKRMEVEFVVRFNGSLAASGSGLEKGMGKGESRDGRESWREMVSWNNVACYHGEIGSSTVWHDLRQGLPKWVAPTNGRYGGVEVSKKVEL